MPHREDPHREVLVSAPGVTVSSCACGHVHLDLGAVTVRFDAASFGHVVAALAHAQDRLRLRRSTAKIEA